MEFGNSYSSDAVKFFNHQQKMEQITSINNIFSSQKIDNSKFENTPRTYDNNTNNNHIIKRKKSNKKVKFNDKVEIVYVESYKNYNKIYDDDDFNINNYLIYYTNNCTNNNNNNNTNNINRNKCSDCNCHII